VRFWRKPPGCPIGGFAHAKEGKLFVLVSVVIDFDHAAVDAFILPERFCLGPGAVGKDDGGGLPGFAGDVPGGQDQAVLADDDAGALAVADDDADDGGVHSFDDTGLVLFDAGEIVRVAWDLVDFEDERKLKRGGRGFLGIVRLGGDEAEEQTAAQKKRSAEAKGVSRDHRRPQGRKTLG
jgi:hypothetical protein